jgi:heme-degrading monooxygenase HmoA
MAYVHFTKTKGQDIETFRAVAAKHNAAPDIDGLLACAAGTSSDGDGLLVLTIWESKAHCDRWAAEQLFPAFQALGLTTVPENSEFTEYEAGELYIR